MSKILPVDATQALQLATQLLQQGEVVALPTDTIYGLAANALNEAAVQRVFEIKQRPPTMGLPVFIAHPTDLPQLAHPIPPAVGPLTERFWPGGLTLILQKAAALPPLLTGGQPTIAVRIPAHAGCRQIVELLGAPLTGTSANRSGAPTPRTAAAVAKHLGKELPLILDGGPSPAPTPSTIVNLSQSPPRLLRRGVIDMAALQPYLPNLVAD